MSESEIDNNKKEMIESEIVEVAEEPVDIQPVVVKKGSFFSFLAFVLSLVALGLSGYMYYLQYYPPSQKDESVSWIDALKESKKETTNKINLLDQQLKEIGNYNLGLSEQIKVLKKEVEQSTNLQSDEKMENQSTISYDDSLINQQILDLQNKLSEQDELIEQLQTRLNTSTTQNQQSLAKLSTDLSAKMADQTQAQSLLTPVDNSKSIAGSFLQEAYVQLNINGNIAKSQELLSKTIGHLANLTGLRYGRLATELETFSQQLSGMKQTDVESIQSQIQQLSEKTAGLEFLNADQQPEANKDVSWYDKLITIKKIDDSNQTKLSKSEQITIINVIGNHYQMMKIALMSNNQNLWLSEITHIQKLLSLHFANNAQQVQEALIELKATEISPQLPDLETYLQQFKAINRANENE